MKTQQKILYDFSNMPNTLKNSIMIDDLESDLSFFIDKQPKKQLQNLNIKNEILNIKETIEIWLKQVNIENYTINDDMTVDCSSSVDISCLGLKNYLYSLVTSR